MTRQVPIARTTAVPHPGAAVEAVPDLAGARYARRVSPSTAVPPSEWVAFNALAFAVRDRAPVTRGHTWVVLRRTVGDWFAATSDERAALLELVDVVKRGLDAELRPDGYVVGFDVGTAAGEAARTLHVHVIPRFSGDRNHPIGDGRVLTPGRFDELAQQAERSQPQPRAGVGVGPDPVFIERVLALLERGKQTATYKYAVLLGLMDLCLELTTSRGAAPSSVTTKQLAAKVLELYWSHATPYPRGHVVLQQNAGSPAKIVSKIAEFRQRHLPDPSASLARAQAEVPDAFARLLREVEWTLVEMPLPKLQRMDGLGEADREFLYTLPWSDAAPVSRRAFVRREFRDVIPFAPEAAEQLALLAHVLRPVVQRHWAAKVAQLNAAVVQDAQLEEFLFGAARVSLEPVRGPLLELHDGRCFYCRDKLGTGAQVDHFVAWSRHPDNGIDNLVPAHARCNEAKSDHLAATAHVADWLARTRTRGADLQQIASRASWGRHVERTLGVGQAFYLRLRDGVPLWVRGREFERAGAARVREVFARCA